MEVTLEKGAGLEATLNLSVTKEELEKSYQKKLRAHAPKVQMKGFRNGQVPPSLVDKMHGRELRFENLNEFVNKGISDYLRENQIEYIMDLVPLTTDEDMDLKNGEKFNFSFKMGLVEGAELPDFGQMETEKYEVLLSEEEFEKELDNLLTRSGHMIDVEAADEECTLTGELKSDDGQKTLTTHIAPRFAKEDKKSIFTGLTKGQTVSFILEDVFDDEEIDRILMLGKDEEAVKGPYTFTVEQIRKREKHTLNEELFAGHLGFGPGKTVDEYTAEYREMLHRNLERLTQQDFTSRAFNQAIEAYPVRIAEDFVKEELGKLMAKEGKGEQVTPERAQAEIRGFKQGRLADEVLKAANLRVKDEDVLVAGLGRLYNEGFGQYLDNIDEEGRFDIVRRLFEKERDRLDRALYEARINKAADQIAQQVKPVTRNVSFAQFNELTRGR